MVEGWYCLLSDGGEIKI